MARQTKLVKQAATNLSFEAVTNRTVFKPGAYFEVKLLRPIMFGARQIRPNAHQIILDSDTATANRDAIISAREVNV